MDEINNSENKFSITNANNGITLNIRFIRDEIKCLAYDQKFIKGKHGKPDMRIKPGSSLEDESGLILVPVYPDRAKHNMSLKLSWLYSIYETHKNVKVLSHHFNTNENKYNKDVNSYIKFIKKRLIQQLQKVDHIFSYRLTLIKAPDLDKQWETYLFSMSEINEAYKSFSKIKNQTK